MKENNFEANSQEIYTNNFAPELIEQVFAEEISRNEAVKLVNEISIDKLDTPEIICEYFYDLEHEYYVSKRKNENGETVYKAITKKEKDVIRVKLYFDYIFRIMIS
jgi:hypothetical protein